MPTSHGDGPAAGWGAVGILSVPSRAVPRGSPPALRVEIKPLNLVCVCGPLKENRHFSRVHVLGLNVKFLFRPYPQSSC